ncbi:hypothetical protein NHX12_003995, partial [Muraenolepis orangiensis]
RKLQLRPLGREYNRSLETQENFPELDQNTSMDELGSGEVEESSATDCDDEDGCQASGDAQDETCMYTGAAQSFLSISPSDYIFSSY